MNKEINYIALIVWICIGLLFGGVIGGFIAGVGYFIVVKALIPLAEWFIREVL